MGLVARAVSEVVPTASRTVDGGFVNSAVRSTSNRFLVQVPGLVKVLDLT